MAFIQVLIIIISILLILVVLIQNSKGGGISSNFAGNTQIVGVKRQAELIEKITWGFIIALFVLCIATASFKGEVVNEKTDSVIKNSEAPVQPNTNTNNGIPQTPPTQPEGGGGN